MPRIKATTLLCLLLTTPVQAEVYRWTDATGSIHFSDKPPERLPHTELELRNPVTVPMADNLRRSRNISATRDEVQSMLSASDTPRKARGGREHQNQHATTCDGYRKKLDRIQSQLRAGYKNDRGNSLREKRRRLSKTYSRECILR
ncbi:DUF4124 domain-containing protein [Marinobacter pelagius]|uniref:DUF4124 domain-containing protein n=1 Tax=Marinobacter sp. C7 TaxID=2951363 RepID=UPI001EEFF169|nr:DUF4124 domain-containing protein [Marinobacter sp. C7]MCG7198495.1 DUF4124 domain-containing protein [Marinobacter sp. C7]